MSIHVGFVIVLSGENKSYLGYKMAQHVNGTISYLNILKKNHAQALFSLSSTIKICLSSWNGKMKKKKKKYTQQDDMLNSPGICRRYWEDSITSAASRRRANNRYGICDYPRFISPLTTEFLHVLGWLRTSKMWAISSGLAISTRYHIL